MYPRNLGIDFPLDRLTLIERGFRPSAEILLLQLPHESYFVEELPRVHFSTILYASTIEVLTMEATS